MKKRFLEAIYGNDEAMEQQDKNRIILPFLILFTLLLIGYFTFIHFRYPLIGLKVNEENGQWVVSGISENTWAASQPIQEGDVLKSINGENADLYPTIKRFQIVEMADMMTIENGEGVSRSFSLLSTSSGQYNTTIFLITLIFSVITIFLSIVIYKKAEKSPTATILIYFLLSIGTCYISAYTSARGELIGRVILTITFPITIILLIHFLRKYLMKFDITFISKRLLRFLYAVNIVLVLSFIFVELLINQQTTRELELLNLLILVLCLVLLSIRLFIKHRFTYGSAVIKIFNSSLIFAFGPFLVLYLIPDLVMGEEFLSAEYAASFLIVIPITLVYLLMAEKLLNIDFIVARLGFHAWLALPFALILVVMITLLTKNQFVISEIVINFILIFLSIVLLLYIKEYLDYKFHNHLISKKNDFETSLYSFFQKVKNETKVNSFLSYLQLEIQSVLDVKEVVFCEMTTANQGESWSINGVYNNKPYIQQAKKVNWNHYSTGSLVELIGGYGIIIGGHRKQKHIIFISKRISKTNLNIRERIWLETLAYFSSILLENFQLIEDLINEIEGYRVESRTGKITYPLWLSRLLFSLAEKERTNLSIDLHDSVLQDQLQLLREIEQIETKITNPGLKNDLLKLQEKMLDNIHLVRETCNELQPPFLSELGVIQSIQNLINQTNLRCSFILTSELDKSIQWLDKDVELTLYRVVQELLNNAMEHSEAQNVSLKIQERTEMITLTYKDDGIGFNLATLQDTFKTMGLFGIQERVKSIGGTVTITSAEGEGMSAYIEIKEGRI